MNKRFPWQFWKVHCKWLLCMLDLLSEIVDRLRVLARLCDKPGASAVSDHLSKSFLTTCPSVAEGVFNPSDTLRHVLCLAFTFYFLNIKQINLLAFFPFEYCTVYQACYVFISQQYAWTFKLHNELYIVECSCRNGVLLIMCHNYLARVFFVGRLFPLKFYASLEQCMLDNLFGYNIS